MLSPVHRRSQRFWDPPAKHVSQISDEFHSPCIELNGHRMQIGPASRRSHTPGRESLTSVGSTGAHKEIAV